MTDHLKPEDRALIERIYGGFADCGNFTSRQLAKLLDAAREEGPRAPSDGGKPVAWRWRLLPTTPWHFASEDPSDATVQWEPLYVALPPSAPGEAWRELPDGLPARGPVMVGSAEWGSVLVEDYNDLDFFLARLAKWSGGPTHWRTPPASPAALQTKEQSDG